MPMAKRNYLVKIQKVYNKLVRDNIPKFIKESGVKYKVIRCPDEQILSYTTRKLIEEVQELINVMLSNPEGPDQILSECADIYSVLVKLASIYDIEETDILDFEETKTEVNGGFEEEYILQWVEEDIIPEEYPSEELTIPAPGKKTIATKKKLDKPTPPKKDK